MVEITWIFWTSKWFWPRCEIPTLEIYGSLVSHAWQCCLWLASNGITYRNKIIKQGFDERCYICWIMDANRNMIGWDDHFLLKDCSFIFFKPCSCLVPIKITLSKVCFHVHCPLKFSSILWHSLNYVQVEWR